MARTDPDVDRLFQLPPGEFIAARNALAKGRGADRASIQALQKPPLAAWAVNQLYWTKRDVYDALVGSAEALRHTHKAVLSGRSGDIRAAGRAHDGALDRALKESVALLDASGHKTSEATRQALVNTLRALPGEEPAGHLTHTLQPGGFEMLAGITPRAAVKAAPKKSAPPDLKVGHTKTPREAGKRAARERAEAKEAAAAAARQLREAEQRASREEFEAARAAREEAKAAARLEEARTELAAAERRARESADQAAAARDRADAARAALDAIKSPSSRDR